NEVGIVGAVAAEVAEGEGGGEPVAVLLGPGGVLLMPPGAVDRLPGLPLLAVLALPDRVDQDDAGISHLGAEPPVGAGDDGAGERSERRVCGVSGLAVGDGPGKDFAEEIPAEDTFPIRPENHGPDLGFVSRKSESGVTGLRVPQSYGLVV